MERKPYLSPKGIAYYPCLRKPETFKNKIVGFTVKLKITDAEAAEMQKTLLNFIETNKKSDPQLASKDFTNANIPIYQDQNGDWFIKFKSNSEYITKKNEIRQRKIPIYDAQVHLMDESIDVTFGSTIIVSYTPSIYYISPAMKGVKLFIKAVQVLEMAEKERTGNFYGFSAQEGYAGIPDYAAQEPEPYDPMQ